MNARILYIMAGQPWPCDRGDRIRNYHLLQALLAGNDVTLVTLDATNSSTLPPELQSCRYARVELSQRYQGMQALLHPCIPLTAARRSGNGMVRRLHCVTGERKWDVIIAGQLRSVPAALSMSGSPIVLDLADSLSRLRLQQAETQPLLARKWIFQAEAVKAQRYENHAIQNAAFVTVASAADAYALQHGIATIRIGVVPNGTDVPALVPEQPRRKSVLFVGNCRYSPNLEGLLWFVRRAWPLVLARRPDAELDIIGEIPASSASRLRERRGICVHGYVNQLSDFLSCASVVINPVRVGTGSALKSLEALSWGRALVSTPAGCRGLDIRPGLDVLAAERADDFADAVCRCLTDENLRQALGQSGRLLVESRYSWKIIADNWRTMIMKVAGGDRT